MLVCATSSSNNKHFVDTDSTVMSDIIDRGLLLMLTRVVLTELSILCFQVMNVEPWHNARLWAVYSLVTKGWVKQEESSPPLSFYCALLQHVQEEITLKPASHESLTSDTYHTMVSHFFVSLATGPRMTWMTFGNVNAKLHHLPLFSIALRTQTIVSVLFEYRRYKDRWYCIAYILGMVYLAK